MRLVVTILLVVSNNLLFCGLQNNYFKDVYMQNIKMSKDQIKQIEDDYYSKVIDVITKNYKKLENYDKYKYDIQTSRDRILELMFKSQVNINNYDKYKELGVDCTEHLFTINDYDSILSKDKIAKAFFKSLFIFSATVIETMPSSKTSVVDYAGVDKEVSNYFINYKLKIDKIIKGEYLIDKFPEIITMTDDCGFDVYQMKVVEKGDEEMEELVKERISEEYIELSRNENVLIFLSGRSSDFTIEDFIKGKIDADVPDMLRSSDIKKIVSDEYIVADYEKVLDFLKKLETINNSKEFLKRSYK